MFAKVPANSCPRYDHPQNQNTAAKTWFRTPEALDIFSLRTLLVASSFRTDRKSRHKEITNWVSSSLWQLMFLGFFLVFVVTKSLVVRSLSLSLLLTPAPKDSRGKCGRIANVRLKLIVAMMGQAHMVLRSKPQRVNIPKTFIKKNAWGRWLPQVAFPWSLQMPTIASNSVSPTPTSVLSSYWLGPILPQEVQASKSKRLGNGKEVRVPSWSSGLSRFLMF